MINALICSGTINLSEWEAYVPSRAEQAQSTERRWPRFLRNHRIKVRSLYVPLVMAAIHNWHHQRLYLALDTTVLCVQSKAVLGSIEMRLRVAINSIYHTKRSSFIKRKK